MTEKRTYKRYPKEFKEEAVALVREEQSSYAAIGHVISLGV